MSRLSDTEIGATAAWLASVQLPTGMIPWWPGGHADPWNHVEAAMALDVAGRPDEAAAALRWLRDTQLPDGSWCLYYLAEGVEDPRRDPNVCAYVATGVLWHYLTTGDADLVEELWPTVEAAVGWVLGLQRPGGELVWSRDVDGRPGRFALLTGTSSIHHSLRCAAALGELLDQPRPAWLAAAEAAGDAIRHRPEAFEPKDRWAMDWYYPVLSGALDDEAARRRIEAGWTRFVYEGVGVRCVEDHAWVTAAETAECVIALDRVGLSAHARQLLTWTRHLRADDGAYWTGCAHPECVRFPGGERSTYSAAAVLMADHIVSSRGGAAELFRADPVELVGYEASETRAVAARRPEPIQAGTPAPR
jgi:Prenyltransferase and squalene oxidase repeat